MIYEILNIYKEVYSDKNNFRKYYRKRIKMLFWISLILGITILILLAEKFKLNLTLTITLVTIPLFLSFQILFYENRRVIKKVYKCKNLHEVSKIFKKTFIKKLRKLGIYVNNTKQLDYLIDLIDQQSRELKPKSYIRSGIIAGVLGPLWIGYCNIIFEYTNNIDEATCLFFYILLLIGLIVLLLSLMKIGVIDEILYSDFKYLVKIKNIMKEYRLLNMKKHFKK